MSTLATSGIGVSTVGMGDTVHEGRSTLKERTRSRPEGEPPVGTHWVDAFDGRRLAQLRTARGMTQTQVAAKLYELEHRHEDTPAPLAESSARIQTLTVAVSNYESGKASPRGRALANLATVFGVDVLALLATDTSPTLATLRARLGLNQQQVAEQLGMSRPLLGHVEQGRRDLDADETGRMAAVLQVTPEQIRDALAASRESGGVATATS